MKRPLSIRSAAALCTVFVTQTSAFAIDFLWNNPGTGNWFEPTNWNTGTVPSGGNTNHAFINNGGTAVLDADMVGQIQDAIIGRGAGSVGTLNQTGGTHTNSGWLFAGQDGGTGTYNMSGTTTLNTGRVYVGLNQGTGTMTMTGNSTVNTDWTLIGTGNAGNGSLTVSDNSTYNADRIYVGGERGVTGGTGTMTINTTGTVTARGDLSVGSQGGQGILTIKAGTVNANTWMIVGETHNDVGNSSGTVVQEGGVLNVGVADVNGRLWLGSRENNAGAESTATYTISGGVLNTPEAQIGRHYSATFNQSGGIVNINNRESGLGEVAGSVGTYNMSGGTLNSIANFQIGRSGTGNFIQTGGVVNANGFPSIGRFGGGNGTLTVTGGSFNQLGSATRFIVGEDGTGTLNLAAQGAVSAEGGITVGQNGSGIGTLNLNGGTLATGRIVGGAGQSTVNFNGTIITANQSTGHFMGSLKSAVIGAGGAIFDTNGHSITFNQSLSHDPALGGTPDGGLVKGGAGTLSLSLENTYTGKTMVSGGTLKIAVDAPVNINAEWNADSLTGAAGSFVDTWAATVGGKVAAQPTAGLQPTLNVGTLNGHNSVAFNGGATQSLDIAGVDSPVAGLTDYTIAFVMRSTTNGIGGTAQWWGNTGIIDAEQPGAAEDWGISLTDSGRIGGGQGNGDVTNYSTGSVTDGNPHVVVFSVIEGGGSFLSIDGGAPTVASGLSNLPRNASLMRFGAIATGAGYFTGEIGEVRVYDGGQGPAGLLGISASLAAEFGIGISTTGYNVLPDSTPLSLAGVGATLDLSGFSETIGSLDGIADTEVILGGGTLTFGGNNTSTQFFGKISGTGGIVKTGTGTFDLNSTGINASAFNGPTVVSAGKLRVNGELSGTSSVQVATGAALGGVGTITTTNGNVVLAAGAKLEPGVVEAGTLTLALGTGVLDVSAAVGVEGSGALVFQLGTVANADLTRLTTGQLSLGISGLEFDDFTFSALAGFGEGTYTLFDTSSPILGSLGSDLTGTIAGLGATLSLSANNQDVLLTVVPEPSSAVMLVGGMLVLARRRRRA